MTDGIARTIDEFKKNAPPQEKVDEQMRHLHALRQAEVSADRLTGHPDWDVFLSFLQHAVNETANQRDMALAKLNDPTVVDHGEMLRLKIIISECASRITTLLAVIQLPKEIKEKGEKARTLENLMASAKT